MNLYSTWPQAACIDQPHAQGGHGLAQQVIYTILCEHQTDNGCRQCRSCYMLEENTHPDYHCIAPEESQAIKIDQVRECINAVQRSPRFSQCQIIYIEHAERMTTQCANALLKTLEEPKEGLYIIVQTDRRRVLLPTILSRCQIIRTSTFATVASTPVEQQISTQPQYHFLRFTHRNKTSEISGCIQDGQYKILMSVVLNSIVTTNWQPLSLSEELSQFDETLIYESFIHCLYAVLFSLSDAPDVHEGFFEVINQSHLTGPLPARSVLHAMIDVCLTSIQSIRRGMVSTQRYRVESTLTKLKKLHHKKSGCLSVISDRIH